MADRVGVSRLDRAVPVPAEVGTVAELARVLRYLRRREARRRRDSALTHRELAAQTGWSPAAVGEYLGGRTLPPADRFDLLIQLLGATPAEQPALATARDRVEELRRSRPAPADPHDSTDPDDSAAPDDSGDLGGEPPVPRQLPPATAYFAGRAAELAVLQRLAEPAPGLPGRVQILAIHGTAGVGKTALALHWGHRMADRFPDGQLYVNLRGFDPGGAPMPAAEAVRGFLAAFAVPPDRIPTTPDAQAALYRSLLAGRRMLVLLDNAADADQVRPLLPGNGIALVLVTSRNSLAGLAGERGAHPVRLDLLDVAETRELLARRLGRSRIDAEPGAVERLAAHCAGLPLALAIVAARAAAHPGFPLAALAAELRDARNRLDLLDGGDPASDVRAVLSWSYRQLRPEPARLLRLLGCHPGPDVGTAAAASLAGVPVPRARALLAELVHNHLVAQPAPDRYACHDLLLAYAAELARRADPPAERQAALGRALDHYLHSAQTAARLLDPRRSLVPVAAPRSGVAPEQFADRGQAERWLGVEHPVLVAAIGEAAGSGFDAHAWQLASTLASLFQRYGHWHDLVGTQQTGLTAARRLGDRPGQAGAHRALARACTRLHRVDEAEPHYRQAMDLYADLGDRVGQAHTYLGLSWVCQVRGRHQDALEHARQALRLYAAARHRSGRARALNGVGWYHARLGNYQRALTCCRQAIAQQRKLGDRRYLAGSLYSLGYVHRRLGDPAQAASCYRQAAELYRDLGDRYNEADALVGLGDAERDAGSHGDARRTWRHALVLFDELCHPDAERASARLRETAGTDLSRQEPREPSGAPPR